MTQLINSCAVAAVLLLGSCPALGLAQSWQMQTEQSTLGFVANYDDSPVEGRFDRFNVQLDFDPDAMTIELSVSVDVTSVDTDNAERDEALAASDWFGFEQFPSAQYRASTVTREADGRLCAEGTLTLKGVSKAVPIKFTWEVEGDQASLKGVARMVGDTQVNRLDFNVGEGDWADPVIGHDVEVQFDLRLRQPQS